MSTAKERLNKTEESHKRPGTNREAKSEGDEFISKKSDEKDAQTIAGKEADFDKIRGNKK